MNPDRANDTTTDPENLTMGKPTKIDANTRHYRGFTITRNFTSPRGTWRECTTQQGYRVTPDSHGGVGKAIRGRWQPSLAEAASGCDYLIDNYATLSRQGREIVDEARRIGLARGETLDY